MRDWNVRKVLSNQRCNHGTMARADINACTEQRNGMMLAKQRNELRNTSIGIG